MEDRRLLAGFGSISLTEGPDATLADAEFADQSQGESTANARVVCGNGDVETAIDANALQTMTSHNEPEAEGSRLRQNPRNRFDVNQDGFVAPIDVLWVINALKRYGGVVDTREIDDSVQGAWDVNADFSITPLDVLLVINSLGRRDNGGLIPGKVQVTYAIGNSLTNDLLYKPSAHKGLDQITEATSNPTVTGWHLNCGNSLTNTWENPDQTCTFDKSRYRQALSQAVDNVFLQPHYNSTVAQEIQSIKNFIDYTRQNPANADTRFFLYAPWGEQVSGTTHLSFYDTWVSHSATLDGDYIASKSTFELMMKVLKESGYELSLIPAGHAFASIIQSIRSGTNFEMIQKTGNVESLTFLTENGVYRDSIHASWTGSFISGLAAYASIYGAKPNGINPRDYNLFEASDTGLVMSPTGARALENVVWEAYLNSA